jgi:hypothetical protein
MTTIPSDSAMTAEHMMAVVAEVQAEIDAGSHKNVGALFEVIHSLTSERDQAVRERDEARKIEGLALKQVQESTEALQIVMADRDALRAEVATARASALEEAAKICDDADREEIIPERWREDEDGMRFKEGPGKRYIMMRPALLAKAIRDLAAKGEPS